MATASQRLDSPGNRRNGDVQEAGELRRGKTRLSHEAEEVRKAMFDLEGLLVHAFAVPQPGLSAGDRLVEQGCRDVTSFPLQPDCPPPQSIGHGR